MSLMRQLYEDDGVQRGFCAMCDHPITSPVGKRRICRKPECKKNWFREYGARKRSTELVERGVAAQFGQLRRTVGRLERSLST